MRPRPAVLSAPLCARQKRRSVTLPSVVHIHSERMHRCPTRFLAKNSFDHVWSQPPRTIAKPLGISDVGHAKACRRADLVLPPRGYWAKLAADKTVKKLHCQDALQGLSDRIRLGSGPWELGTRSRRSLAPDPPIRCYKSIYSTGLNQGVGRL